MKRQVVCALIVFALTGSALAQEAPPPRKMPRIPVAVQDHKTTAIPPPREVQGQAIIIDGEKLHVGDLDLRLFGIVPPQLSASFGPQARTALDELTAGQNITCLIRDRDREGRFLATCSNASNVDLALELLRRGLAVTARGSVASTELAASYGAAEQLAMTQRLGLWSVVAPVAAVVSEAAKAGSVTPPPAAPQAPIKTTEEKPAPTVEQHGPNQITTTVESVAKPTPAAAVAIPVFAANGAAAHSSFVDDASVSEPAVSASAPGFLERYQLLVTGLVMLTTAFGLFGAIAAQRLRNKRAEMQALAAALRGELMAAHAVCRARLRSPVGAEDKDIVWPRLRSTLYQAYVGRLGWLGAGLARHVASIYGQASDYAAYYADDDGSHAIVMPKRQALQALMRHIDEVLPRLAIIEHTGRPLRMGAGGPKSGAVMGQASLQPVHSPASLPAAQGSSVIQEHPATSGMGTEVVEIVPLISIIPSPLQIWTAVQKLTGLSWGKKKTVETRDHITEYTALIEEEMKRFSFVEEHDEHEQPHSTDVPSNGWSPKAHEGF